jgi:hypothetical protein
MAGRADFIACTEAAAIRATGCHENLAERSASYAARPRRPLGAKDDGDW